jgi:hypothetical protein
MTEYYKSLPTAQNIRDSFMLASKSFNKHSPTTQQLADAFKRASNLMALNRFIIKSN